MTDSFRSPPLARWDGLHLVLDLQLVERHLDDLLSAGGRIRDLRLQGAGDAIAARATVLWKGIHARVGFELAEIKLRRRHIGLRMRKLRALSGVPVPRAAVELGLISLESPLLTVFRGQGILVVDLRSWIPVELDLEIVTVQATARSMHVWFGPGQLQEIPGRGRRQLPAGDRTRQT